MKLARIWVAGEAHIASLTPRGLLDITLASADAGEVRAPRSLDDALTSWEEALKWMARFESQALLRSDVGRFLSDLSAIRLLPPLAAPSKILCVFVNYRSHGQEVGSAPSEPVFFFKHSRSLVGDGGDILMPAFSEKVDHEVELGVVMGKEGKDIKPEQAYDHVAGYTVLNDVSFRDGMRRGVEGTVLGRNLYRGKVADSSLPMGPFIVTRDEIPNPYPLRLTLKVNGEIRQDGTTTDMIFRIPELIASASEDNTLLPGDVIATGTCSGVGLYTGKYLKDGDWVEAEVEKVGVLKNRVRAQKKS